MAIYLVLGGTGKTGARLTRQLVDAGHHVRVGSRNPGDAAPGVEPVAFDWDNTASHDAALSGVTGVWVVPPALRTDFPPLIGAFAERAVTAGAQRLVFLSARGADQGGDNPLIPAERALAEAAGDADWTVVRPSWFNQNFTEGVFAPGIISDGVVVAPTGDRGEPFIDAEDIAAVGAAALTSGGHAGRAYDLSGPRVMTFAEAAAVLSEYAGQELRHVDVPQEQWVAGAVGSGLPADYAEMLGGFLGFIRAGHDAHLSDGIEQALGRPPTPFEDWATREAPSLRS